MENKSIKIAICGSLDFTYEIDKLANKLRGMGFEVYIPPTSEKILKGEFSLEEIKKEKESGKFSDKTIKHDAIRTYWNVIKNCNCILVANYDKKGIKNYIGGNSFLEIGFAHILQKKIFLLNGIPEMIYSDEIKAMQPTVLNGDLSKIL